VRTYLAKYNKNSSMSLRYTYLKKEKGIEDKEKIYGRILYTETEKIGITHTSRPYRSISSYSKYCTVQSARLPQICRSSFFLFKTVPDCMYKGKKYIKFFRILPLANPEMLYVKLLW
jgi:hypothetical protein